MLDVVYGYLCKILGRHDERLKVLESMVETLEKERISRVLITDLKKFKHFDVDRLPI